MPEKTNLLSPEVIGAIAGALITFVLAILWQYFTDRRNKIQLTYSKLIESPLSIPKTELKEKLKILYGFEEIKNILYARLVIKNTGQKTIKKQIFSCEFDKDFKLIDEKFPLILTNPVKEILVESMQIENAGVGHPNLHRYQIEALAPGQSVQVEFLFDGDQKDFEVAFRPNQIDEVKIVEGSLSTDPNLEFYITQFGLNFITVVILLFIANLFGLMGIIVVAVAIPFLYSTLVSFRKAIPLLLERANREKRPDYQVEVSKGAQSHVIIGNNNEIKVRPDKPDDKETTNKHQSIFVAGNNSSIQVKPSKKSIANKESINQKTNKRNPKNNNKK